VFGAAAITVGVILGLISGAVGLTLTFALLVVGMKEGDNPWMVAL
jgi:hypothetical protein